MRKIEQTAELCAECLLSGEANRKIWPQPDVGKVRLGDEVMIEKVGLARCNQRFYPAFIGSLNWLIIK